MLYYHNYLYTYTDKNVFWNYIIDRTCECLYTLQIFYIPEDIIKLFYRLVIGIYNEVYRQREITGFFHPFFFFSIYLSL